ncbi:MAG: alkaline phosphatase D family protein, partial [Actinomycetota bacterium]
MDRRRFLQLGLGGAARAVAQPAFRRDPALAEPAPGPFGHGVASGDPLADRVILWTRVTPSEAATPGSGVGPPTEVRWEGAEDADFTRVVQSGVVTATADRDHTVKVDATGLRPATEHWYRFRALGATSPVGRTRTAPGGDQAVERLRFGVVSCSNYEAGYFSAYRHLAARDDLDVVLHLGDYIYEYGKGGYATEGFDRFHDPEHEIVTLADYRRRHALYKTDPDLAALHARYAFITTIDDHEITNNAWADGAENHQDGEGDYAARKAAAMQAYLEWMPVRPTGDTLQIHRQLSFGPLADLFVLDERNHRSKQVEGASGDMFVTSPEVGDEGRTMLGAAQRSWFEDGLAGSSATWKVVASSVMFAPLVLADPPSPAPEVDAALAPLFDSLGTSVPIVLNGDQWDGYRHEQSALGAAYAAAGGVVVLTGDIHSSWAAEIPADPGTYLGGAGESVAVEFVTPAVTSDSFRQAIAGIAGPLAPAGEALAEGPPLVVYALGPWFKYVDPNRHGFGVFEVTAEAAQYDWHHISDRTDPQATEGVSASWRSPVGSNRLVSAAPLGAREDRRTAPPASETPSPSVADVPSSPLAGGATAPTAGSGRLPATGGAVPVGLAALGVAGGLVV